MGTFGLKLLELQLQTCQKNCKFWRLKRALLWDLSSYFLKYSVGIFSDKKFSKLAEFVLDLIYQNKIYNAFDIPSLRLQFCFKLVAVIYLEVCGFLCYGSWKLPSQIIYIVDVYVFFVQVFDSCTLKLYILLKSFTIIPLRLHYLLKLLTILTLRF